MTVERAKVRQMWHLIEPLYGVLYYSPEAFDEAGSLGFKTEPRWPSYFPYRAAPLGPVGPALVSAAFYSFNPEMVARYVSGAWEVAAPADVITARERAIDRTYRSLFGDEAVEGPEFAEAARLARRAAEAAEVAGRPMAAANKALSWADQPHVQLWQAANILREHRGDGHLTALLTAGLDGTEALVSFAAVGAASDETFQSRGWSKEQWEAARERLVVRGLLDPASGTATDAGRALREEVERQTDTLAAGPWQAIGAEDTERLAGLLGTPWVTVLGSGLLPGETTLGIGKS
ncbi:SCO6745 family protein [Streptomyces sp. NPDC055189]